MITCFSRVPWKVPANSLLVQSRNFARMTGRAGKMQHFRYGVAKVRGRWYYRYHKPIGKANWKGYQERYIKPKDVEAKQRLVFAPKATTKQLKQSLSWQWRLPKLLASATTPNQVLDAWILFRYRQPKRLSFYFLALKRLVEVGGCSPSDWRLQVLLGRMRSGYRRVINIDVLLKYFSKLGLYKEIEKITRILKMRISDMSLSQHLSIVNSLGTIKLRDTALTGLCLRKVREHIPGMSSNDLIQLIQSLGDTEIRDSKLVSRALTELIKRDLSVVDFRNILRAMYTIRFRDYTLIELAVDSVCTNESLPVSDWPTVCDILFYIDKLEVYEYELIEWVLKNVDPNRIPIVHVSNILIACAKTHAHKCASLLNVLRESAPLLTNTTDIVNALIAADRLVEVGDPLVIELVNQEKKKSQKYNVAAVAQILVEHAIWDTHIWKRIAEDLRVSLPDFEPADFVLMAKVLQQVPADVLSNTASTNLVVEWSLKRWEEFTPSQWKSLQGHSVGTTDWCKEQLTKWGDILTQTRKNRSRLNK